MSLPRNRITALVLAVALALLAAGAGVHSHEGPEQGAPACAVCHAAHSFGVVDGVAAVRPPAVEPTSVPQSLPVLVATPAASDVPTRGPPASPAS